MAARAGLRPLARSFMYRLPGSQANLFFGSGRAGLQPRCRSRGAYLGFSPWCDVASGPKGPFKLGPVGRPG